MLSTDAMPTSDEEHKYELNRHSVNPLRAQLADLISQRITEGIYPVGEKLPSIRELAAEFDVSRETVNIALGLLRDKNLVRILTGRGAYVSSPLPTDTHEASKSRTDSIAFIYDLGWNLRPTVGINTVYENLLTEANLAISGHSQHMITAHISYSNSEGRNSFESLLGKVDGIIVAGLINPDFYHRLLELDMPIVSIFSNIDAEGIDEVGIDGEKTFYRLARHLIELGHRHIVYLDGPIHTYQEQQRVAGFRRALETRTEGDVSFSCLNAEDWLSEAAQAALAAHIENGEEVDSIAAVNDVMAAAAVQACKEHGFIIPDNISITGSKNTTLSTTISPQLTSLDYHFQEVANIAADRLNKRIEMGRSQPVRIELVGTLVSRDSVCRRALA